MDGWASIEHTVRLIGVLTLAWTTGHCRKWNSFSKAQCGETTPKWWPTWPLCVQVCLAQTSAWKHMVTLDRSLTWSGPLMGLDIKSGVFFLQKIIVGGRLGKHAVESGCVGCCGTSPLLTWFNVAIGEYCKMMRLGCCWGSWLRTYACCSEARKWQVWDDLSIFNP